MTAGIALALLPPIAGLPLAAYASVACLLIGGIACIPGGVALLLAAVRPPRRPLALLAVERARHDRDSATIAVAGVVASLALSVALTVMVASFRDAVSHWLDTVLPADLYVRAAIGPGGGDLATLPTSLPEARRGPARRAPRRRPAGRARALRSGAAVGRGDLAAARRPGAAACRSAARWSTRRRARPRSTSAKRWSTSTAPAPASASLLPLPNGTRRRVFVRGVWRDYARQYGAIVLDARDWQRLTGDQRINDIAALARAGGEHRRCRGRPAPGRERARPRRRAARVRGAARDPGGVAAHLRPQLRRHLLAAGGGDRDRPVRHRRQLLGPGAGAAQGVRPALAPRAWRAPRSSPSSPPRARSGRASARCSAWPSASP